MENKIKPSKGTKERPKMEILGSVLPKEICQKCGAREGRDRSGTLITCPRSHGKRILMKHLRGKQFICDICWERLWRLRYPGEYIDDRD